MSLSVRCSDFKKAKCTYTIKSRSQTQLSPSFTPSRVTFNLGQPIFMNCIFMNCITPHSWTLQRTKAYCYHALTSLERVHIVLNSGQPMPGWCTVLGSARDLHCQMDWFLSTCSTCQGLINLLIIQTWHRFHKKLIKKNGQYVNYDIGG